jgi:hypothetical protein
VHGAPGAARPGTSPVAAGEDEEDEAVPRGCSPEHRWWQRGGAMEAKSFGDSSSASEWGRAKESLKEGEEGAACSEVGCSPFIGARERWGGGGWVVTVSVLALITIDGRAGLRGC